MPPVRHSFPALPVLLSALLAVACSREETPAPAMTTPPAVDRLASMELMARGQKLFQENCAQCHGPDAQGHPDWQTPGVTAAPPLNGTGNDWKRKKGEMVAVIKSGVKRKNEEIMPGWGGRMGDEDIDAIITWYQSRWPVDVYERWRKANVGGAPKG